MKRKFKFILALCSLVLLCMAVVGCSNDTKYEQKQKDGYKISVTYDANGGRFLNRPGVTIVDMFKPTDYQADENGEIHIKLVEPTDKSRWNGNTAPEITLTFPNYFFAGWYQSRTIKMVDGVPVDKDGKELVALDNGTYVYADTVNDENPKSALPAYTYDDYWDFANDTVDYSVASGEVKEIRLYAGWVEYYEFNYYVEDGNGGWNKLDEVTTFDYKTTNAANSTTFDKDTIWLPVWEDGAMEYSHQYSNKETYKFPKVDGTTFLSAYEDDACTKQITESLEHKGSIDLETCTPINRVQNVYIKLDEGEQYRITEAKQLADNPNAAGYYEIMADLDFTGLTWPVTLSKSTFTGKMFSSEGNNFKIENITVNYSDSSSLYGGLFGEIANNAEIKNLEFTNVTVNFDETNSKSKYAQYGLFAGLIDDEASISGIKVDGTLRLGAIQLYKENGVNATGVNLLANGKTDGITSGGIALEIYGVEWSGEYNHTIDHTGVSVDPETNMVTIKFYSNTINLLPEEKFDIQIG